MHNNKDPQQPYIKLWILFNLHFQQAVSLLRGFPGGSVVKHLPANAGDRGSMQETLGPEDNLEKENGSPLQYSCLKNRTEEPGRLQSMESQRVRHDFVTKS